MREEDISLGEYLKNGVGVCREYALLTHLALLRMGVDSRFAYVKAITGNLEQDHGIVLIKHKGELWLVDSYFTWLNGFRLKDLRKRGGANESDPRLVYGKITPDDVSMRIVKIHSFPLVWAPKGSEPMSVKTSGECLKDLKAISS